MSARGDRIECEEFSIAVKRLGGEVVALLVQHKRAMTRDEVALAAMGGPMYLAVGLGTDDCRRLATMLTAGDGRTSDESAAYACPQEATRSHEA